MAGANKRTTGMMIILGLLFIATIVILCLMYDIGHPQSTVNFPWVALTTTAPPTTTTTSAPRTTATTTITATTATNTAPITTINTTSPTTTTTTDVPSTTRKKSASNTTSRDSPPSPLTSTTTIQSSQPQPDESRTTTELPITTPPPPPPTTMTPKSTTITETSPLSTHKSTNTTPKVTTTDVPSTTRKQSPSSSTTTSAITASPNSSPPLTSTTTTQSPQPQPDESKTTTELPTTTPPPLPTTTTPESTTIAETTRMSTQESTSTTRQTTTTTTEPYEEASAIPASTSESTTGSPTSSAQTPCPQSAVSKSANVCMTPACKTLAARMLDLMDHSVMSPCEDFYQYACGGVMDNLFLHPEEPQRETRRFIIEQLKSLSPKDPVLGPLKVFYDSCTAAEVESSNRTLWVSNVKEALYTVDNVLGQWLAEESGSADDSLFNITQILVGMMKINFAPFFDLLLDVSEDGTDRFVLKLTPQMLLSPFSKDMGWAVCYSEHLNRTVKALGSPSSSYNLNEDYEKYLECIREGTGLHLRLEQMTRAVKELGLMHHFNNTTHKQGAEGQLVDSLMDTEFLLIDMFRALPCKSKLHEAHLKKNFKNVTLSYVEDKFDFPSFKVEWRTLVEGLLGHGVNPDSVIIHVYFEEELYAAFDEIDFIGDVIKLRRIMLILLVERLYTDLVEPAQHNLGKSEYCLKVTTELLGDFVSTLYLKNLPHLQERQKKLKEMIKANKEAAEEEVLHQSRLKPEERKMWVSKLRSMSGEVASPEPSQYLLQDKNETILSDNFIENSLILLTRHRSLMYQHYQSSTSSPAVLWNHFLKPFSQFGISLYASNKFLIPYGAMEAPLFFWDVPDYINYAGIGHMIAHELIHGFDETGVRYNGTQRQTLEGYNHLQQVSECLSNQYRPPQSLKAASGLIANFTLGLLPLNEILAGSGAVRLAWEAYELTRSQKNKGKHTHAAYTVPDPLQLPWLDLNPQQLYFLRIAQVHCTATSDIHMLPLMEKEHLPSRLWVKLVLQNEPLFTEAFSCPVPHHPQCPYSLGSVSDPSVQ